MTCNCNENAIEVTKGCSKTLTFNFDSSIEGYSADFCVRKDLDTTPILTKTTNSLSGTSFTMTLTSSDNDVFTFATGEDVLEYVWGLEVYDTNTRTSVFPKTGQLPPRYIVFKNTVEA